MRLFAHYVKKVNCNESTIINLIENHIATVEHTKNPHALISTAINQKTAYDNDEHDFKRKLVKYFLSADICLSNLENPRLLKFL